MKVSKLEASCCQLECAIEMFFHGGDPVAIHTLASAAYEVLRGVSRKAGGDPMIKDWMFQYVKEEFHGEVRRRLNEPQNFFKHADKDPEAVLEFEPEQSEIWILDSCWAFKKLTGEIRPLMSLYEMRALVTWGKPFLTIEEEGAKMALSEFEALSDCSLEEFYDEALPLIEEAIRVGGDKSRRA